VFYLIFQSSNPLAGLSSTPASIAAVDGPLAMDGGIPRMGPPGGGSSTVAVQATNDDATASKL